MLYTVPTVASPASVALATVDAHVHALTAAVMQVVYDAPLQQLYSTRQLSIIHIYEALGNGDAAVPSKFSQHTNAHTFVGKLGDECASWGM